MTTIDIENAIQVPAGLTPVTPTLSSTLIVDAGKATVEDVLALLPTTPPRVITGDATLGVDDTIVIIDSGDLTVSVTLDAGSATRGRCTILWPGNATDVRVLTLIRNGDTGTIDGVSASKVVSSLSAHAMALDVFATDENQWHTDLNAQFDDIQFVSASSDTIVKPLVYVTNVGAVALAAPPIGAVLRVGVFRAGSLGAITITRAGSDLINGATTFVVAAEYAGMEMVALAAGTWGAGHILSPTGVHTRLDDVEADVATNTGAIAALDTRIDGLEGGITPSANIRNTTTAGPHTILAGEAIVRQGFAGSMAYTLPPAIVGAEIDIVKDTTNAGGITLTRAGSDTIHGATAAYLLDGSSYVTSATTFRKMWKLRCLVLGDWLVM